MSGKVTSSPAKKVSGKKNRQTTPKRAVPSITAVSQGALTDSADLTPEKILALQRTAGNQAVQRLLAQRQAQAKSISPAPGAGFVARLFAQQTGPVLQRVSSDEEGDTIGERVGRRGAKAKAYEKMTKRQKVLALGNITKSTKMRDRRKGERSKAIKDRREKAVEERRRSLWNESSRPSFTEDTWDAMLNGVASKQRTDGVTVYQCPNGKYYPRKRDRVGKERYVTIDHHVNWKEYILSTAEPEEDGRITKASAQAAYNDLKNLVLMTEKENSSKNGPKGKYD